LISPSETAVLVRGTTVLELVIKEDGSVENMKTVESAGNDSLDAIATEAIASSAPFGPFPDAFREKELNLRFHLSYNQPASKAAPICGEFHASGHVVRGPGPSPVQVPNTVRTRNILSKRAGSSIKGGDGRRNRRRERRNYESLLEAGGRQWTGREGDRDV
jgi:TonB family protein